MDQILITLLNGLSTGLLLFMLSAGLTLIFSMMGVLNFAHASFYMLGAYIACALAAWLGFWPALLIAPLLVGLCGALFERLVLRRVHSAGRVAELLVTFGAACVIGELVQLVWGRAPLPFARPALLDGPAFTFIRHASAGLSVVGGRATAGACDAAAGAVVTCSPFPVTRMFMMLIALVMLAALWLLLTRTRAGLVIRAALTHPHMAQALGHDVPRVFMQVFGAGCALAALAGVVGGVTFVTEPSMAASVGPIVFVVVVVGGIGSLAGAFVAALLIGTLQNLPLLWDGSVLSQLAPVLPYLLMVLVLVLRPQGLLGARHAQ